MKHIYIILLVLVIVITSNASPFKKTYKQLRHKNMQMKRLKHKRLKSEHPSVNKYERHDIMKHRHVLKEHYKKLKNSDNLMKKIRKKFMDFNTDDLNKLRSQQKKLKNKEMHLNKLSSQEMLKKLKIHK